MTADLALELTRHMLWTAMLVGAPIIGASLLTGLIVSVFQVVTQVQEMSLTFVPKLIVIFFVLLFCGSWMLAKMMGFSQHLLETIPSLVR